MAIVWPPVPRWPWRNWSHGTDHALLVVGCDESQLYVNDPAHAKSPIAVPKGDFELAWLARDYYYALITPMHDGRRGFR